VWNFCVEFRLTAGPDASRILAFDSGNSPTFVRTLPFFLSEVLLFLEK